jgi:hypothetical protein
MAAALIFIVILPFALFLVSWTLKTRTTLVESQRETIDDTLKGRSLLSNDPSFSFDPETALLVHAREAIQGESAPSVQTTRLYKNPAGEYFFFLCTAGSPGFVKHLTQDQAKRMLRPYEAAYEREFGPPPVEK